LSISHTYTILRLSYFPLLWKFSTIILAHKPNKPHDLLSSYRPISLLLFFAKILERLILKRILLITIENNLLLRASHSTIHQVHRLVDAISYALEQKLYCTYVFLDISLEFDRVWYDGRQYNLKRFLPPAYYLIIKSYLIERNFKIHYGSAFFNLAVINAGIPQGGNTLVVDYVDDKAIISINNDPLTASSNLQNHLAYMENWFIIWNFKVNQSKYIHTTFTTQTGSVFLMFLYMVRPFLRLLLLNILVEHLIKDPPYKNQKTSSK